MTIYNLGSINIDNFYRVPKLPQAGETLGATEHWTGLGGKGANQSVASAYAGSTVHHLGAVGKEGAWCADRLAETGVDVSYVSRLDQPTGHANITVDALGENMIVLFDGANARQELTKIQTALSGATANDTLILQNETNLTFEAAQLARQKKMRVIYSAAPFSATMAAQMLPVTDMLVLNEVEAAQFSQALGVTVDNIDVPIVLMTRGADGAVWREQGNPPFAVPAFAVTPIDTTGAGDCFIGYVAAGLDQGMTPQQAMRFGAAASAIQVTRPGTSDAIPSRAEVEAFLA